MNPITKLTLFLWLLYFVGVAVRVLGRAGYAIRNPLNPVNSRWAFVKKNWDTILVRSLFTTAAFYYWLAHPNAVESLLSFLHSPLSFNIPATGGTAPMFGYLSDSLLDQFLSWIAHVPQLAWLNVVLRNQIPAYQNGQEAQLAWLNVVLRNQIPAYQNGQEAKEDAAKEVAKEEPKA